jgi:hypothetical protein
VGAQRRRRIVGFEPTGEEIDVDDEEWWCPSEQRWCWCPGPCPDGTPHGPKRVTRGRARVVRPIYDDQPG